MGALSKMGFSAPTHVQAECIPAAVRDRRDVIGAAQTVRRQYFCYNKINLFGSLFSFYFSNPFNLYLLYIAGFRKDACLWTSYP
jgi:hypothetical protein